MALAGRIADGVILADPTSASYVAWAREHANAGDDFEIVAIQDPDPAALRRAGDRFGIDRRHAAFEALGFAEVARTAHPGFDRPTSVRFEKPVSHAHETRMKPA